MHCRLAGHAGMDEIVSDKMRRPDEYIDMLMGFWALMMFRDRVGLVPKIFRLRKFTWY